MVHGFGHDFRSRAALLARVFSDNDFMAGGLDLWDPAGGGMAMQEHFVTVRKLS